MMFERLTTPQEAPRAAIMSDISRRSSGSSAGRRRSRKAKRLQERVAAVTPEQHADEDGVATKIKNVLS
jgi:hypothetical protein